MYGLDFYLTVSHQVSFSIQRFWPLSSKETPMSEQDSTRASALLRPTTNDPEAWKFYWKEQGQPWRTEPEIDEERQKELDKFRNIKPDWKQGIFPFMDIKLSRTDVEWLLATHEEGRGPVDWSDKSQSERKGLDLRNADLSQVVLSNLPLAFMQGGLTESQRVVANEEQINMAAVCMKKTKLIEAQLQGAQLRRAQLQGAQLRRAQLQGAQLRGAQLQGAHLRGAQLQNADLRGTQLQNANLREAQLQGAHLFRVQLQNADLRGIQLQGYDLRGIQLQDADLRGAQLQNANLRGAQLQNANLADAQLQNANLADAQLQNANLRRAQLNGVDLNAAVLSDEIYGSAMLADVKWGEINLSIVDWTPVKMLGDECMARQQKTNDGMMKGKATRINELQAAVRANRQLAVVLRDQGMNEEADNFAYRAQLLQRKVLWHQHNLGRWLFSMILALLSGYGYRIWRILAAYLLVVSLFAMAYYFLGLVNPPHLPLGQTFLESVTAFHGRVFLEQFKPDTPQIWLTAIEAIAGLIIEGVFIAMLIQRFFSK
jgi:uncharacterized protein YjbI with pentapeptide repeats